MLPGVGVGVEGLVGTPVTPSAPSLFPTTMGPLSLFCKLELGPFPLLLALLPLEGFSPREYCSNYS